MGFWEAHGLFSCDFSNSPIELWSGVVEFHSESLVDNLHTDKTLSNIYYSNIIQIYLE